MSYLPFGTGPRHCIGLRLAMLEAKVALVYTLRKIRFLRTDKTQVSLGLVTNSKTDLPIQGLA